MAGPCRLLQLPVELRLEIYRHVLLDCTHITVGTARIEASEPDRARRLLARGRTPYGGIPHGHEPVVESHYRAALLSAVTPATLRADIDPSHTAYANTNTGLHTLCLLNTQINDELKRHFAIATRRQTSLFIEYPAGLHVFYTTTPQLLRQSRSVHLAGSYTPPHYCPARAACLGPRHAPEHSTLQGDIVPDSEKQLEHLFRSGFGPHPAHRLDTIEMRLYYPGEDSYSTVWGDDESPVVIALRTIAWGEISIEVWRGQYGTGVALSAVPTAEKKRVVSTVWRKLEEGGTDQPEQGSWVVNPQWPEWEAADGATSSTRADTIVSIHG